MVGNTDGGSLCVKDRAMASMFRIETCEPKLLKWLFKKGQNPWVEGSFGGPNSLSLLQSFPGFL